MNELNEQKTALRGILNAPLTSSRKINLDMLKELLEQGVDPNSLFYSSNKYGYPLFWDIFYLPLGYYNDEDDTEPLQVRLLDLMSEYGLDINAKDSKGYTCFNHAAGRDMFLPIKKLLELGADFTLKGPNGDTVLHKFVYSWIRYYAPPEKMKAILTMILESGVDINAVNYAELTAFGRLCSDYWAANQKSSDLEKLLKDMLKILIQYGADIYTPITTLEWQGDAAMEVKLSPIKTLPAEVQKELIEYKTYCDIIEKTEDGDLEIFERDM